jgi:hypothetical protein
MSENGEKQVTFAQAFVSVGIGHLKCYEKSKDTAITEGINDIMEFYANAGYERVTDCFKKALKELEPTSKLVGNFDESKMELTAEECIESLGIKTYENMKSDLAANLAEVSEFTCGNFKLDDIRIFMMKLIILSHEKDGELKELELQLLRENFGTKLNKIFDCVMKNL